MPKKEEVGKVEQKNIKVKKEVNKIIINIKIDKNFRKAGQVIEWLLKEMGYKIK